MGAGQLTQRDFPDLLFPLMVTAVVSDRGARTGKSEVDGSDPPFSVPESGAGVRRNLHLRSTPWGGSLPSHRSLREGSLNIR